MTAVELLVATEVAAMLRVKESTVLDWRWQTLRTGRPVGPPSFRVQGRVVWDAAELEAWIAEQRQVAS